VAPVRGRATSVDGQEQKCKISIDKTELHPLVKLISRFTDFSLSHCHKRRPNVQNLAFSGCRSVSFYSEKDKQGHEISFQQQLAARLFTKKLSRLNIQ
jgi:hypothetical protein